MPKANVIGPVGEAWPIVERMLDRGTALLCAQMLGATIQSIEDGIAVWDRDRKLQHWNRAYMQMWQFPESFLRSGVRMDEMLDELSRTGRAHRLETDDQGKPTSDPKAFEPSGRWLYRRADGRLLSVRRLPIGDEGYMAICSDLTAQKQHEDELVKAWGQAVIANRYDVLSRYAKSIKRTYAEELERLKRWSPRDAEVLRSLKRALLRGQALAGAERARLAHALRKSRALATAIAMRQELVALWERSTASKEQLLRQLQDWCRRADASGIAPLVDFSQRLRSYALA